jgi:L-aspartate oxidase
MSRDAGVVRDAAGLTRLLGEIEAMTAAHGQAPSLVAARLVAACALERRESRGAHYRTDYPQAREPVRTFVTLAELGAQRFAAE